MTVLDLLLGRPLASDEARAECVGPATGIPIFGLDALSSAADGTEAAVTLLIPLGAAGIAYMVPISASVIVLLQHRLFLLPSDDPGIPRWRWIVHCRSPESRRLCRPPCGRCFDACLHSGWPRSNSRYSWRSCVRAV